MTARYTVQKGETARDVAYRYTGDPSRYIDLIPVNPHLKTVIGQMGKPVFHRKDWHDGMSVKLPDKWIERGEMNGRLGNVGRTLADKTLMTQLLSSDTGLSVPMWTKPHEWKRTMPRQALNVPMWNKPKIGRGKNTTGPSFGVDMQGMGWNDKAAGSAYDTWLGYFSTRIWAFIQAGQVGSYDAAPAQSAGIGSLKTWLLRWPNVNAFYKDMEAELNASGPSYTMAPPGVSFVKTQDVQVCGKAAQKYARIVSLYGAVSGPRRGTVGCGCSSPAPMRMMTKVPQTPFEKKLAQMYPQGFGRKKEGFLYGPRGTVGVEPLDPGDTGQYGEREGDTVTSGGCTVTVMTNVKPYYYKVQAGDNPDKIAKTWLGGAWTTGYGPQTTMSLLQANHDKAGGFKKYSYGCNFKYFNAGDIIKIPAAWPAPPTVYSDYIVNIDGSRYVPKGDEKEPDVPGANGDRVNWFGDDSGVLTWVLVGGAAIAAVVIGMKVVGKKRR